MLKRIIIESGSVELGEEFISNGTIIYISREYDVHLTREIWIMLIQKEKEKFDVERIFKRYFADDGFGRYGCLDLIMKLEWSLFGHSVAEDYLDIPSSYSVFLEDKWLDKCRFDEIQIILNLWRTKEEDRVGQTYYQNLIRWAEAAKKEGTIAFWMYISEYLLRFKRQNHIEISKDEIGCYLALALFNQNRRLIADAFRYYVENGNDTQNNLKALHRLYIS